MELRFASNGKPSEKADTQPQSMRCLRSPVGSMLDAFLQAGPDPAVHGVVRWRRVDLQKVLKERLGVEVHERTVGKYLTALGYHRLSVRPQHPDADPEAQEAFKKTSAKSWRKPSRQGLRTSPSKSGFKTKPASASKAP